MIASVEHSYAVANAHPDIRKLARCEARPNYEYGVTAKIKELLASER